MVIKYVTAMSRVVIIGAGFGGLGAAQTLVGSGCEVVLVDSKDWFTIGGTWHYAWSKRVSIDGTKWQGRCQVVHARSCIPAARL